LAQDNHVDRKRDLQPPLRARSFVCVQPLSDLIPVVHSSRPLQLGTEYLAELCSDGSGHWQLFEVARYGAGAAWPDVICTLTSEVLDEQFEVHGDALELEKNPGLFVRVLPGDSRTYAVRESLSALGGRWNPQRRAWSIPEDAYEEALFLVGEVAEE
jgi:hypothetical protein